MQQGKEFSVEPVAMSLFISNILSAGIEDAEVAPEIPEGVADSGAGKDIDDIAEPG